jgi:hypothetical protein
MMMMIWCDLLFFYIYVLTMLLMSLPECEGHVTNYGC